MEIRTSNRPGENRLLKLLPPDELQRLRPTLVRLDMDQRKLLFDVNQPIEYVYFPISGVASLVTIMDDGATAEVATVGNEGLVGMPVFFRAEKSPVQAFIQVRGEAYRMSAEHFRQELNGGPLDFLVRRYAQAMMNQMAQSVACNRLHSIEQRMCRWLLMTHDRVFSDDFPLTQEFLAQMLGVRRPSVTVVASILQKAGFIRYHRGNITIVDRGGLEGGSCECYAVVRAEFDRLLGSA